MARGFVARMRPEGSHLGWKAEGRNPGRVLRKAMTVLLPEFRFAPSGLQGRVWRGVRSPDEIRGRQ